MKTLNDYMELSVGADGGLDFLIKVEMGCFLLYCYQVDSRVYQRFSY